MTFRASRRRVLPALVVIGLALTGCTAQPDPTPTPTPSPSTEPTAAPTTEPDEAGIECDEILSADGSAKLAADGLDPVEPQLFDPLAMQLEEAGGTACAWGKPLSDIGLTVVQLNVPDTEWEGWEAALAEVGYVEGTATGTYTGPVEPGTGVSPIAVVTGDRITVLSAPVFADLLAPHTI